MKTIQERVLSFEGELCVEMPEDSEIVAVDMKGSQPTIFFIGNNQEDAETEERHFFLAAAHDELHPQWIYVGTITPAAMGSNSQYHVIETTDTHRAMAGGGAASAWADD